MVHKSFGEIPAAVELTAPDTTLLQLVEDSFSSVGALLGQHRLRQAIAEAMRTVGEVNKYVTDQEPYKLKDDSQRDRLATILHVTAQAVSDCNTLLAPFLPHSANAVHRVLGGDGEFVPMPRIDEVDDLDGGAAYPIITGDYTATPSWGRRRVVVGTPVAKPAPIFTKLDVSVVDDEMARLGVKQGSHV